MKNTICAFLLLLSAPALSQDMAYARKIVDTLTSPYFWGRGYTNDGIKKAADFIAAEMKSFGLIPVKDNSFFQEFSHAVNTFPGKMEVSINGKDLVPGADYILAPVSKGVKGKGTFQQKDSVTFIDAKNRVIVQLENKLTWSPAGEEADYTVILIDKKSITDLPSSIKVNIENKMINDYKVRNVAGMIRGMEKPDSLVVITAHYDHLGGLGEKTYFPGANDNASGISMLLNFAKYYAAHPPKYSMVFIAFAGEEIGLLGSKYFTDHPLFNLKQVRFLLNLDLVGTGDEGVTVVNATEFKKEFDALTALNRQHNLLTAVNARGKAANSDHHWFTEKGVPAFFIYTLGGIKAYHDVFDKAQTLPLTDYADLFQLLVKFNATL